MKTASSSCSAYLCRLTVPPGMNTLSSVDKWQIRPPPHAEFRQVSLSRIVKLSTVCTCSGNPFRTPTEACFAEVVLPFVPNGTECIVVSLKVGDLPPPRRRPKPNLAGAF